jgi:hypothetical protein
MPAGTYSVQAKTNGGTTCVVNMAGTPIVKAYSLPTVNAGLDQTICQYEGIQLNATGGNAYKWAHNRLSNADSEPYAKPLSTTCLHVVALDATGCTSDYCSYNSKELSDAVTNPTDPACNDKLPI